MDSELRHHLLPKRSVITSRRQRNSKRENSPTGQLFAQLFARLLAVAAMAAALMFIVMAGVWLRARREADSRSDGTTTAPHLLHHLVQTHFTAHMPWMPSVPSRKNDDSCTAQSISVEAIGSAMWSCYRI